SHWLFDVLPRLHVLRKAGLYDTIDWFLFPNHKLPYQIDTLGLLGIPSDKIIEGDEPVHLKADRIVASSPHRNAGQMERWVCDFLRDAFLKDVTKNTTETGRRIYITRNDSPSRKVLNEADLVR